MYGAGRGVAQSYVKAMHFFKMTADQGNADAQEKMGDMHEMGHGVAKSDVKAFQWDSRAADHGICDAQYKLGLMYLQGRGVVPWCGAERGKGNGMAQNSC